MTVDLIVMHGCQNRFAIVDEGVSPIPELRKSALVLAVAARLIDPNAVVICFPRAARGEGLAR